MENTIIVTDNLTRLVSRTEDAANDAVHKVRCSLTALSVLLKNTNAMEAGLQAEGVGYLVETIMDQIDVIEFDVTVHFVGGQG